METDESKPNIQLARKLARSLLQQAGVIIPPIWLNDIVKHLKKTYDLSIYSWALGDKIDGIQVTQGEQSVIAYNDSKHPHRKRFTVAHEIGHLVMGHTQAKYDLDPESKDPREIEANQFAAELLMPLSLLNGEIKNGNKNIKNLAKKYYVSEEAMWRRLMECKLISKF